jgi:hypothetical protein
MINSFMKKSVILILSVILLFSLFLVSAQNNTSNDTEEGIPDPDVSSTDTDPPSELTMMDKARKCVQNQINDKGGCSELSFQEKVFSLASIGSCKGDLLDEKDSEGCFPKGGCDVKSTAISLLALKNSNSDISGIGDWISSQNKTASDMTWFLQITPEVEETTECSISYGGIQPPSFTIGKDKKINTMSLGTSLLRSDNEYWFEIDEGIYGQEIIISCNTSFKTNLLFKETNSPNINVDAGTKSASAEGTTSHVIDSYCLKRSSGSNTCNYEATLWGTLALASLEKDVSGFYPYLITASETHTDLLPQAFLYQLTSKEKYLNNLFGEQKLAGYWMVSGEKYYDTAIALDALRYTNSDKKDKTINWIKNNQDGEGCWNSQNLRDTSLIIYSLEEKARAPGEEIPEETTDEGIGISSCIASGYYCLSSSVCQDEGGEVKDEYSCGGSMICCSRDNSPDTCSDLNGDICSITEQCVGGTEDDSISDLWTGEICCVEGTCESIYSSEDEGNDSGEDGDSYDGSNCRSIGGTCKVNCEDDESENFDEDDCAVGEYCCVPEKGGTGAWIWILIILIILVVLAIIFRDKLKEYWMKIKEKAKKRGRGPSSKRPPGFPPRRPPQGPRRIMSPRGPPRQGPSRRKPKKSKELDETLKKLKEMGK